MSTEINVSTLKTQFNAENACVNGMEGGPGGGGSPSIQSVSRI